MKKIGLVPKLIIAIVLGILVGTFLPAGIVRIFVTFSDLFGTFLKFVVPLMIIAFVTVGIADLTQGAGKLLGITTILSYVSTVIAGTIAFFVAITLFPKFMDVSLLATIGNPEETTLAPYFKIDIPPLLDVTSAIVFAFIMGLGMSTLRSKKIIGETSYNVFSEFSKVIVKVLECVVIPFLPVYILGTFANMTYSGETFAIVSVLWKVFLVVIILHVLYISALFFIAGGVGKKNPLKLIKNQIPGYLTAVGTQSSAACIPVNLECADNNGTSREISEFVIPLCATIHMAGSIITITCCVTSVLLIFNMPVSFPIMMPLVFALGIAMIAAPGAPGGSIMAALPFLPIVGISSEGAIASLLIALYITQDSFGTAANISGDNALAVIIDAIYKKFIKDSKNKSSDIESKAEEANV